MPEIVDRLRRYQALLLKWQKSINLVSSATLDEAWERHFEDSLQIAPLIPEQEENAVVFDIGSGAGFPGMVLAIARADLAVTLIESDTKKCTFLSTVSRETFTPVTILNQRIESVCTDSIPAFVTARALAPLDKLLGYCLPWAQARPELVMLFLKGARAAAEIEEAKALYAFDAAVFPSKTAADGCILRIGNLARKSEG